jgi:hypothetical protein
MRRLLVAAFVIGLLIISAIPRQVAPAEAYPPVNDRYFAYLDFNRLIPLVQDTGVITWRATDAYGWSAWHDIVARALNTGSSYQYSYGNVLAAFVVVREAYPWETPILDVGAYDNGYVSAKCGGSFATACVDIISQSFPVHIWASAPKLQTYVSTGQDAVVEHETHHPTAHACDEYIGGCPPTQGLPLQCTGNPDTLMDCGLAARYPVQYDIDTFIGVYLVPPFNRCNLGEPVPCVGFDPSYPGVYWIGLDWRARVVSIAYQDSPAVAAYWVASFTKATGDPYPDPSAGGFVIQYAPGRCVWVLQSNFVSWPSYQPWQLAGCL